MDSFIFYKEWKSAISGLSAEDRLTIYEAIIDYATTGEEPQLTPTLQMAFTFIRGDIDRNERKWEDIRQKRSEAAKKSHEARAAKLANAASAANAALNVNDNVNVDVNGNVNVNSLFVSNQAPDGAQTNKEEKLYIASIFLRKGIADCIGEAADFYNYYEAIDWETHAGKKIKSKTSAARAWKPKRDVTINIKQAAIYGRILDSMKNSLTERMLTDYRGIEMDEKTITLIYASNKAVEDFEAAANHTTKFILNQVAPSKLLYLKIKQ